MFILKDSVPDLQCLTSGQTLLLPKAALLCHQVLLSSFANFEISRSHHPMQERKAKAMFVAKVAVAAMAEKATTLQITAVVMMSRQSGATIAINVDTRVIRAANVLVFVRHWIHRKESMSYCSWGIEEGKRCENVDLLQGTNSEAFSGTHERESQIQGQTIKPHLIMTESAFQVSIYANHLTSRSKNTYTKYPPFYHFFPLKLQYHSWSSLNQYSPPLNGIQLNSPVAPGRRYFTMFRNLATMSTKHSFGKISS
jgi:hypothetical protein